MAKKVTSIPVNAMSDESGEGIVIETISFQDDQSLSIATGGNAEDARQFHRHDRHSFFLLRNGSVTIEIDFETYQMKAPCVLYLHPDQVHRITAFQNVTVGSWSVNNENLNPEYLTMLEEIAPAKPMLLTQEAFSLLSEAVSFCTQLFELTPDKLYHYLLKDSCNALVALVLSQYVKKATPTDKLSRFETVTKAFRHLLERNYTSCKRPAEYARQLNLSTPYLNECVRHTTGYPVSYHIQQRVILEAKRLLYHSGTSVKEIAAELGYDDYPYFSRLFTKVAGMTALTFRNKNRD